ncbi:MAG: hypothetical protein JJE25_05915 [Bacteroidia bacterium]|nr:hypothetical protein [Bacteroidia bacterium]
MGTIYSAIAIFGMTAILGMYLLSLVLRNKQTPKGVAILHGLFAVTGLVLLIIYCFGNGPGPWVSVIVFTIAALGGFILVYKDITGRKVPKWLGIVHGLTAVAGFALLLVFAFW